MKVPFFTTHRGRGGPVFVIRGGERIAYVPEFATTELRIGGSSRLPTRWVKPTSLHIIDARGVTIVRARDPRARRLALLALVLGLLLGWLGTRLHS